jgi:ATP-dependent RNA helicase DDX23/PRP28
MPAAVEKLAKEYLRRPVNVTVGVIGQVVDRIEQRVEMVSGEAKKLARLQRILSAEKFTPPIMIFVNLKKTCDTIAWSLGKVGVCLGSSSNIISFGVQHCTVANRKNKESLPWLD